MSCNKPLQSSRKHPTLLVSLLCGLLGFTLVTGCGESISNNYQPARRGFDQFPRSDKSPNSAISKTLRTLRRTHIDLLQQLPTVPKVNLTEANAYHEIIKQQKQEIRSALLTARTALTLGRSWTNDLMRESSAPFAEVDHLISQGHQNIATSSWKKAAIDSLSLTYANWIYQNSPSSELLAAQSQIATPEAMSFFNLEIASNPQETMYWPGTQRFQLPGLAGGLLNHPSLFALFSAPQRDYQISRHRALLSSLFCMNLTGDSAHQFTNLSSEQLHYIDQTATTHSACKGCHQPLHALDAGLHHIYTGRNLAEWLNPQASQKDFHFLGTSGHSTHDFFEATKTSEVFQACSARNLFELLKHAPLTVHELNLLSKALSDLSRDFNPQTLLIRLLSDEFFTDGNAPTSIWQRAQDQDVTYLNGGQLRAIAEQLGVVTDELMWSAALDAAPSSAYFWEISQITKAIAERAVAQHYQQGDQSNSFLSEIIPHTNQDHAVTSAFNFDLTSDSSKENVQKQEKEAKKEQLQRIHRLWFTLTAQNLHPNNLVLQDLAQLFELIQEQSSQRQAWETVLYHILNSPAFFTY